MKGGDIRTKVKELIG